MTRLPVRNKPKHTRAYANLPESYLLSEAPEELDELLHCAEMDMEEFTGNFYIVPAPLDCDL